ncbi:GFA family protein [Thalassotalea nanhaiensis]|uniref:GFA family protein n=1 Tax=Thalassotalea nanhaiensis TaxID=3065648 RepID=A0ABY9TM31_9GAMM|nr:GFA family protein [Colwelliaceae bacterium SQ345]
MKGVCNCGAVSFSLLGEIPHLYQCHCTLCQKQGGSTSNTATMIAKKDFVWLSGEELITKWQKGSGFSSHFCKCCGSPVPNPLRDSDFYWIPMGLLENVNAKVVMHIYCDSKAPWDVVPDSCKQDETMPEQLSTFIDILKQK